MLLDDDAGRRGEGDAINGSIWRLGRKYGVPTPVNETVVIGVIQDFRRITAFRHPGARFRSTGISCGLDATQLRSVGYLRAVVSVAALRALFLADVHTPS